MIKVFNADDHPILRKGVSDLINQAPELQWVGCAANGTEALEKIKAIRPDVAILDIEMPQMSGLEVAQTLLNEACPTKFILLTLFKDKDFLNHALNIGVKGYLLKESSETEILDCIRFVNEGKSYVNASMTQYLVHAKPSEASLLDTLSEHEINILKLVSMQKTTNEIADMLFISPKTVANHRSNIGKKLALDGVQNGLLKWAIENRERLK